MAKYLVLYTSMMSATETMDKASPEDMDASMAEWMKWRDEAGTSVKVDFGMPLQAVATVTASGVADSDNTTSGYSMLEGDKEAVMEVLKNHPHLKTPGSSIELLELLPIPGMDS